MCTVHGGVELFGIVHATAIDSPTTASISHFDYYYFLCLLRYIFFLVYQFFRAFFSPGFGSFKSAYMHSHVENTIFGKNGIRYEWKQFMSKNNVCRFVICCCCCCSISSAVHCNFSVWSLLPWFSWSESHLINAFDVRDVRSTIFHYTMQQKSAHAICTNANPMASVFIFFFWILNSGTIGEWHSFRSKIWPTYFYFVHHRKKKMNKFPD